jgi:hypothetical protein
MDNVTWILDERCFDDNLPELKDEITRQGCNYITGKTIPFGGYELHSSLFDLAFAYGSLQFCSKINRDLGKNPNLLNTEVFCNLPQFACNYYYPRLSRYLFNQEHAFLPYGELIDKEEWVFKTFGIDDCVFMRPSSGFKEFTGQVYEKRYWKGTIEVSNTQIQPEDLVVIAEPQLISAEYRIIIGPSGPITSSLTHLSRKLYPKVTLEEEEQRLFSYVNKVLDKIDYWPDPFWVMDVVSDFEDNLSVLEVNSMSCSGFYKCDLSKIVKAIKDYFNAWNFD